MVLLHPIYLLLALPLAASLWVFGFRSRWLLGFRIVSLTLIVLALSALAGRGVMATVYWIALAFFTRPFGIIAADEALQDSRAGVISFIDSMNSLRYAIYGVFAFCPDCGVHNSRQILDRNLALATKQLALAAEKGGDLEDYLIREALSGAVASFDGFGRETCRVHASRATDPQRAEGLPHRSRVRVQHHAPGPAGVGAERARQVDRDWHRSQARALAGRALPRGRATTAPRTQTIGGRPSARQLQDLPSSREPKSLPLRVPK